MNEKTLSFKFDVDSIRCMEEGIPNLLQLSRELKVPFSFFMHLGRSTSRSLALKKRLTNHRPNRPFVPHKFSSRFKLGNRFFLETLLLNSRLCDRNTRVISELSDAGHELALHGGRNHAEWEYSADAWSKDRVLSEIEWGLERFHKLKVPRPVGYSSPGWVESEHLVSVLDETGFRYINNDRRKDCDSVERATDLVVSIPTNITGEGGAGYLEACRAKGLTESQILGDFRQHLQSHNLAVVYDHPFYAGIFEIDLLRKFVMTAQDMGFKIATISSLIRH